MKTADIAILKQEARTMRLLYTSDAMPGYMRRKVGKGFVYYSADGNKISDEEEIRRIKSLVLPPAWTRVWICTKNNGHLQATGYDKAGRKQYKYHAQWSTARNEKKHNRMLHFARALPVIRKKLMADLRKREFTKEKVLALAISIMDKTHIRVGNSAYTKMYGSYGLTSLQNKHVKFKGNQIIISFKGKKGVLQDVALTHNRLCRLLKKLRDIPGQELFQFYDTDGTKKSIDSGDVNEYLALCSGQDFTAKDFRTWWGTVIAFGELAALPPFASPTGAERNIVAMLDAVAKRLGNTRAVCKKYYVHPAVLACYAEGKLEKHLQKLRNLKISSADNLKAEERIVLQFLKTNCAA